MEGETAWAAGPAVIINLMVHFAITIITVFVQANVSANPAFHTNIMLPGTVLVPGVPGNCQDSQFPGK